MTSTEDNRPYRLIEVGLGDYDPTETTAPAYSNIAVVGHNPWPLFSREQMEGFRAITSRDHFQPFFIEQLGTYAVVMSYDNSLPEEFDLGEHMDSVRAGSEVDVYDDGKGFRIDYADKLVIEVDGEQIEAFNFDCVGYDFWMADEPVSQPAVI